jgi:hypothetical protein
MIITFTLKNVQNRTPIIVKPEKDGAWWRRSFDFYECG